MTDFATIAANIIGDQRAADSDPNHVPLPTTGQELLDLIRAEIAAAAAA